MKRHLLTILEASPVWVGASLITYVVVWLALTAS